MTWNFVCEESAKSEPICFGNKSISNDCHNTFSLETTMNPKVSLAILYILFSTFCGQSHGHTR